MTIKKFHVQNIKFTCKCGFERAYNIDNEKLVKMNVIVKCPNCGKALEVNKS